MKALDSTRKSCPTAPASVPSPAQALDALLGLLALWQRRSDERRQLASMSAARLADIGITRDQALAEAAKPFWRA